MAMDREASQKKLTNVEQPPPAPPPPPPPTPSAIQSDFNQIFIPPNDPSVTADEIIKNPCETSVSRAF